jgi:hypothetical protein
MTKPDEIHAMVKEAEAKLGSAIFSSTTPGFSMSPIEEFPRENWDRLPLRRVLCKGRRDPRHDGARVLDLRARRRKARSRRSPGERRRDERRCWPRAISKAAARARASASPNSGDRSATRAPFPPPSVRKIRKTSASLHGKCQSPETFGLTGCPCAGAASSQAGGGVISFAA